MVRAGGMVQSRYGVKRRGRENGGRVRKDAVEREAVVSAVDDFGYGNG